MKKPPESMKHMKWLLTTLIISSTLVCSAQYFPFPYDDAVWEGSFIGFIGYPQKEYYVMCGDTTFENNLLPFRKIYQVNLDSSGNVIHQTFVLGIIEENGQQLIWASDGSNPAAYILYDFNLEVGDKFITEESDTLWVDSIGYTDVDGEMRRTTYFEHHPDLPQEYWIEGIGSNFNLVTRGIDLASTADYTPYLECFRKDNELLINLFPGESECTFVYETGPECVISTNNENLIKPSFSFEIYPNPAQHYINLNIAGIPENPLDLKLIDIVGNTVLQISPIVANQGNIALGDLSPGMYFLQLTDPAEQSKIAIKKLLIQR